MFFFLLCPYKFRRAIEVSFLSRLEIEEILVKLKSGEVKSELHTFSYVQIEEIAIQNSLDDASDDCNQVVVTFSHISVNLEKEILLPIDV